MLIKKWGTNTIHVQIYLLPFSQFGGGKKNEDINLAG